VTRNAEYISRLCKDLYERVITYSGFIRDIGEGLCNATKAYNKAVGSLETRLLPQARRFKALDSGITDELKTVEPVDLSPRSFTAPELLGGQSVSDQKNGLIR
jgi:DNA recombination protein RmuC